RGGERPPDDGGHTEGGEEIGRDRRADDPLRLLPSGEVRARPGVRRDMRERRRVGRVILNFRSGNPRRVALVARTPEHDEALRIAVWEWAEQHRFDNAEDRGVRSNAESERENRDDRERGCAREST